MNPPPLQGQQALPYALPSRPSFPRPILISLVASICLYLVSCFLPALAMDRTGGHPRSTMYGGFILLIGWAGLFTGVIAWFANPVGLVAVLLLILRKFKAAFVTGLVAVGLAATTLMLFVQDLPGDEGGVTKSRLAVLLPGFYLWLIAIGLIPVSAYLFGMKGRQQN